MSEFNFMCIPEFSDQYYSQNIDYSLIKKIGTYVIELTYQMENRFNDRIGQQCKIIQVELENYQKLVKHMENQLVLENRKQLLQEFKDITKLKPSTINTKSKYYINNFIMKNFDRQEQLNGRFDWINRSSRLRSQEINSISNSFYNFE